MEVDLERTDYALLEQLLTPDTPSVSHSPSTIAKEGLTLSKLSQPIEQKPHSITAILKTHSSLSQQIQAVLSQTTVPENIWITGDQEQAELLQEQVEYVDNALKKVKTEYVWILDENVLPGHQALEYMMNVSPLLDTVVGTEGDQNNECSWTDETSRIVSGLRDSWVIKTEWIPYWQNQTLFENGILSVLLPSDPVNQAHWGNTHRAECVAATAWKPTIPENSVLIRASSEGMQNLACDYVEKNQSSVVVVTNDKLECNVDHLFKDSDILRIVDLVKPKVIVSDTFLDIPDVPVIQLDKEAVPFASWIADLSVDSLADWNTISIKIMVSVNNKNDNLKRFLESLDKAYFMGDTVDLTLLMDYSTDRAIQQTADHYRWTHGPKYLRHRIAAAHRMAQFSESWYPTSNNDYAIILDTELELSPQFYTWAKYSVLRYRNSSQKLFGVSLYRPELIETDPEGRRFFTERPEESFLMQWPSYSGALFFPEHWREFHDYITTRLADREGFRLQDVNVPNSRSNEWKMSWRRYFEELVYLRSYVMLYPPVSLSTRNVELKKKSQREKYTEALSLYKVPLMTNHTQFTGLPVWDQLPVVDFYGHLSSFETIKLRGAELQDSISSCLPNEEIDFDPSDLLCPFARIVMIELENEGDPLPELPLKKADVYV